MQFTLNSYSPAKVKQYQTRLSSAGLVYKHFGREVIATFVRDAVQHSEVLQTLLQWPNDKKELSERELDVLYTKMYEAFVEEVDGVDNGVECFSAVLSPAPTEPETSPVKAVLHRNYQQSTSLSSRVGQLQTWWNEPQETENKETKENMNFAEAMEMAGIAFFEKLFFYAFSWLPARGLVEDAFNARFTIDGGDSEGRIVVFHNSFCPWKDHLFTIEEEHAAENKSPILYVLYSDGKGWRVQAVPKEVSSFESRKALPFKGLRDEELSAASGIEGGVFVHVSGFIGGMKTLEGALALAKKAIEA
ncbi:GAMM1 protein [Angomonas deanei]|uniref:Uncharacterized protein n=1 Tax=Angomonas deanei TaxID=59799 RepID=A0A7G2CMU3_9TRYP|nr:GAMM1 protein [Angomonas deanei]CAD2220387.1 Uncharacterised protein family (UPF0160), putative [Angomonas deanei]|eukprot:EPY32569.1 GAMM1 protein [Angomonas deanei]